MDAYNVADLERQLIAQGWTVAAEDRVTPQATPGDVHLGGYTVALTDPAGVTVSGDGRTRSDALRAAAEGAGLIGPEQPHLQ
jgi:hypothetical protein